MSPKSFLSTSIGTNSVNGAAAVAVPLCRRGASESDLRWELAAFELLSGLPPIDTVRVLKKSASFGFGLLVK